MNDYDRFDLGAAYQINCLFVLNNICYMEFPILQRVCLCITTAVTS